jgi:hypothetical protein
MHCLIAQQRKRWLCWIEMALRQKNCAADVSRALSTE